MQKHKWLVHSQHTQTLISLNMKHWVTFERDLAFPHLHCIKGSCSDLLVVLSLVQVRNCSGSECRICAPLFTLECVLWKPKAQEWFIESKCHLAFVVPFFWCPGYSIKDPPVCQGCFLFPWLIGYLTLTVLCWFHWRRKDGMRRAALWCVMGTRRHTWWALKRSLAVRSKGQSTQHLLNV